MPDLEFGADHVCCVHPGQRDWPDARPLCHFDRHGDQFVTLNQRQLDGWACFYCGQEPTSLVPVGRTITEPANKLYGCAHGKCRWHTWVQAITGCCEVTAAKRGG